MPQPDTVWTVEMLDTLPDDGRRYEIIDGELFITPTPSLTHQRAVGELCARLDSFAKEHRVGFVLPGPLDITFSRNTNVLPDVVVLPDVGGRLPRSWEEAGHLLLAIEIRSAETAERDVGVKRQLYQRQRVPEYWSLDCDARVVERWFPYGERPEVITDRLAWWPPHVGIGTVIDLPEFFDLLS